MNWIGLLARAGLTVDGDTITQDGDFISDSVTADLLTGKHFYKMQVTAGENLAAGDLCCITGWDATNLLYAVSKADSDATVKANRAAQFVASAAISQGAQGYVVSEYTLTAQNTDSASAVGDPVYLSTTAGGWTLTSPTTAGFVIQKVGVVSVKSATVGQIRLFPWIAKSISYVS